MSAESSFWGAHAAGVLHSAARRMFGIKVRDGWQPSPTRQRPQKLNNRGGTASDESIQGQIVGTGRIDTIVNDVKFFLHKYENGEPHRGN